MHVTLFKGQERDCPRPGCTELWVTWAKGNMSPCPSHRLVFKIPSKPGHSVILGLGWMISHQRINQSYLYFEKTGIFLSLLIVVMCEVMLDNVGVVRCPNPPHLVAIWCFETCSCTNWELFVYFLSSWSVKQIGKPRFHCPYAVKSLLFAILSESGILWDAEQMLQPQAFTWSRIKGLNALRVLTTNIWCPSSWFPDAWKDVNEHPSGFSCFLMREQSRRIPVSEWCA